jgi:hypothetical protein
MSPSEKFARDAISAMMATCWFGAPAGALNGTA